jgi:transposase-like protein
MLTSAECLGNDAGGLSATTIGRLKEAWSAEHARWSKRDLSAKHYVYFWADGIYVQARLEDAAACLLSSSAPRRRARRS